MAASRFFSAPVPIKEVEDEEISSQKAVNDAMWKLGYKFDLNDIAGIKLREANKGGMMMIMYTCAVDGCNTK